MNESEHTFLPENVDEQIDALSQVAQQPDARLISHLRGLYEQDREIVERVEERLAKYQAEKRKDMPDQIYVYSQPPSTLRGNWRKGPQLMKPLPQEPSPKRKRVRFLEMLVAVLILAVLVGSMAFVLNMRRSSQGKSASSTSTASAKNTATHLKPTAPGQSGLYVTTRNGIARVSLTTGKVLWQVGLGTTGNVLVDQGIVIFSGGDSFGPGNRSNFYVEAVRASDGQQIWRVASGPIDALQGANGIVYVSACSPTGSCAIDALRTGTGQKLWSHASSQGTIWELFQNGVVYGVSYTDFFALNATTGAPLWQKTLQNYPNQEANMTPLVSGNAMYFSSCNTTKQTPDYGTCDFFAFNATSGAEMWHVPFSSMSTSIMASPTVMDGVVYAGSLDGIIHAYDAGTGSLLWTYNTGGAIYNPLLSSQGLVYVEVQQNTSTRLLALKATRTSHSIAWSQSVPLAQGKPDENTPVIAQGRIYLLDSNNAVETFQAASGNKDQGYTPQVGASISSFALAF